MIGDMAMNEILKYEGTSQDFFNESQYVLICNDTKTGTNN